MNLSAYRSAAREIPAVRTSVIPIDSLESGGCSAAEAINHAAEAINKISLKAADKFATIAGKNRLKSIKSPSVRKISRERKISCQNGFERRFGGSKYIFRYIGICIAPLCGFFGTYDFQW